MNKFFTNIWVYLFSFTCLCLSAVILGLTFYEKSQSEVIAEKIISMNDARSLISQQIGPNLALNQWPEVIRWPASGKISPSDTNISEKNYIDAKVEYTIDPELQKAAEKILQSYKPDYGAIVMMEATTGEVLALVSYQKKKILDDHLALRNSFPAASIFKIVTATAAIDRNQDVNPETKVDFNGGNHTLYKKNVMSTTHNRWTRSMSLKEAFARSVNTVFGRLTLERLSPQDLEDYAIKFGFNREIATDLPYDPGFTEIPKEKNYHLTELASGFNKVTRMSPIQGAMIGASIAADGNMPVPYIVKRISDDQNRTLFQAESLVAGQTMNPSVAHKLKDLMEATITEGTSRKSFRSLVKDKKFQELVIGGKTGSLTGDNPKGKVDWFVGYAMNENQKIAIAALTVNVNFWTVKSSYVAQSLFRTHFKEQFSKANERFFAEPELRSPSAGTKRN